jgi:hypothetical protein
MPSPTVWSSFSPASRSPPPHPPHPLSSLSHSRHTHSSLLTLLSQSHSSLLLLSLCLSHLCFSVFLLLQRITIPHDNITPSHSNLGAVLAQHVVQQRVQTGRVQSQRLCGNVAVRCVADSPTKLQCNSLLARDDNFLNEKKRTNTSPKTNKQTENNNKNSSSKRILEINDLFNQKKQHSQTTTKQGQQENFDRN